MLSDSFVSIYLDRAEQGIEALAVWWITIEQFYYLASTLLDRQSKGHWSDRKKKRFSCLYSASRAQSVVPLSTSRLMPLGLGAYFYCSTPAGLSRKPVDVDD
jgi:hypothetical protein